MSEMRIRFGPRRAILPAMRHAALRAKAGGQTRVRADAGASGLVALHRGDSFFLRSDRGGVCFALHLREGMEPQFAVVRDRSGGAYLDRAQAALHLVEPHL